MRTRLAHVLAGPALLLGLLSPPAQAEPYVAAPAPAAADGAVVAQSHVPEPVEPGTRDGFELVGHSSLFARGMNAAPAVYGDHVYVGNRTDGSEGHRRPGVLVVDASDPTTPRVVNSIGAPNAGNSGETTRELRVWPQQKLLMVLGFTCSAAIHECSGVRVTQTIKFYDLTDPAAPALVSVYVP